LCSVIAALNGTVSEAIEKSFGTDKPAIPYYDPIKGYILKTPPDLGDYAQQFGCVTGVLSEDTVCAKEIITALSNPVYATAVAEVYSKPEKQ
jgi:hypothetical protein